jgi:hypothetical protein
MVQTKDNLINPSDHIGKKYQSGYKPVDCDGETITTEKLAVAKRLHEMGLEPDGERDYTDMVTAAIKHDESIDQKIALLQVEKQNIWEMIVRMDAEELAQMGIVYYLTGKFIPYADSVFQKVWLGDAHILRALMYIAASFKLQNPDEGIHLHVTGNTQSGKSDSIKTGLKLISTKDQLTRTFSSMGLFYAAEKGLLHENCIVFSDDTKLNAETAGLYRNMLTSWDTGVTRITVRNLEAVDLNVPRHISLILTSIDTVSQVDDEGQDASRFLTMEVRRTSEQEDAIWEFVKSEKVNASNEIFLLHCIWDAIPELKVTIPKELNIPRRVTIRESKRFLTLVKCHALLCNREVVTDEDVREVERFLTYSKPMIDATTPARTRKEQAILDVLTHQWQDTDQIQALTKMTGLQVYRALRGRTGTFDNPSGGLMGSVPNLMSMRDKESTKWLFRLG